jgi:hypothetical protein
VGFVLCVNFGNMCICIYCFCIVCTVFLYCFVYVYVFLLVSSVLPPSDNSIAVSNDNNQYTAVNHEAKSQNRRLRF